jgi:hypothetical protein
MPRPIIRIHDLSTDQIIDREMNDDEFAFYEKNREQFLADEAAELQRKTTKLALLERLGITTQEAELLLIPEKSEIINRNE